MAEYNSEIIADDANFQDDPWNFRRRKNAVKLPVELIRSSCVPGTSWFTLAHFVWISAVRQIMSLYNYTIARKYSDTCKLSQIYEVYLLLNIFNRTFIRCFYLVQQFILVMGKRRKLENRETSFGLLFKKCNRNVKLLMELHRVSAHLCIVI